MVSQGHSDLKVVLLPAVNVILNVFIQQSGLVINHHASNTLESFGRWAERNNNPLDNDENHYDYATLFTR